MRPGGARRAPVRVPGVVAQGQAVPAVVSVADYIEADRYDAELAASRQRARDRAADGTWGYQEITKNAKAGDR